MLRLEPDTDGTGELFVCVRAGAFSGAASAYFALSELEAFAERLGEHPLPGAPIEIEGGAYDRLGTGRRIKGVRISAAAVGGLGQVRVTVDLASQLQNPADPSGQDRVVTHLLAYASDLDRFRSQIGAMLNGVADTAVLAIGSP